MRAFLLYLNVFVCRAAQVNSLIRLLRALFRIEEDGRGPPRRVKHFVVTFLFLQSKADLSASDSLQRVALPFALTATNVTP